MKLQKGPQPPLSWGKSFLFAALAVVCFHLAYTPLQQPAFGLFIFGYALCLVQLTNQKTIRRAFYSGLVVGFLCVAPQLHCFWEIFSIVAIVLWLIMAFWIGVFVAIVCACIRRWGNIRAMWLVPFIWTGLEYFRSELYYLKFSWLNVGYVLPVADHIFGMYGLGFLVFAAVTICFHHPWLNSPWQNLFYLSRSWPQSYGFCRQLCAEKRNICHLYDDIITIAGIQMEFPYEGIIPRVLQTCHVTSGCAVAGLERTPSTARFPNR